MWLPFLNPISPLPDGLASFRSFLKSEFSEENLEFWVACEDYKRTQSAPKRAQKARRIYEEFIRAEAPREVGTFGNQDRAGRGLCSHTGLTLPILGVPEPPAGPDTKSFIYPCFLAPYS